MTFSAKTSRAQGIILSRASQLGITLQGGGGSWGDTGGSWGDTGTTWSNGIGDGVRPDRDDNSIAARRMS